MKTSRDSETATGKVMIKHMVVKTNMTVQPQSNPDKSQSDSSASNLLT